jgi:hypothetical protein
VRARDAGTAPRVRHRRGRLAVALVSLLLHAALIGVLLRDEGPRRAQTRAVAPGAAQRALQVSWVRPMRRSTPREASVVVADKPRAAVVRPVQPRPRRAARAPVAAPVVQTIVTASPPAATPTRDAAPDGSVFGLPQIGFAAMRSAAARAGAVEASPAMQQALFAQQQMQAAAMRAAARGQLQAALQRELDAWPALDRAATCRLRANGPECDDDALREPLLARVDALTIEFRGGRYHGGLR